MISLRRGLLLAVIIIGATFVSFPVFASATDGTIDSVNKYVWGEKIGWINFSTTFGNIHVTNSSLTGYAWNDLYGWIHMNPTQSGVMNDGAGNLSGYAWSENLGWINFSGVIINSNGKFTGQASGDNTGIINFDCSNCNVQTDWRQSVATPSQNHGGGYSPIASIAPTSPLYNLIINNNDSLTDSQAVNIYLYGGSDVAYVWLSENANLIPAEKIIYDGTTRMVVPMILSSGEGIKTIYTKFCNTNGYCGSIMNDNIEFKITPFSTSTEPEAIVTLPIPQTTSTSPVVKKEIYSVFEDIKEIISESIVDAVSNLVLPIKDIVFSLSPFRDLALKINSILPLSNLSPANVMPRVRNFIAGIFRTENKLPNINRLVSRTAPFSMSDAWRLMPVKTINSFVFAPLPKEFAMLENKFPKIEATFKKVGVERFNDLSKLSALKLNLPGINEAVGLTEKIALNKQGFEPVGLVKNIPVAQLTKDLKGKIPSDFVFVSGVNELVNYNVSITLSDKGRPEQKIMTISGQTLELVMRPDKPAKNIKGYIVYKGKKQPALSVPITLKSLFESLVFAQPVFAYNQEIPVEVEERLVLLTFEYTDPDNDGLYTASIKSPVPEGEYEIITVIEFDDPVLGKKEIRMITVVDPEGYVFEKIKDKELRVNGAIINLYWFDPQAKEYVRWPASEYQQENPQITDLRGSYSFLTPLGKYYLQATAEGYKDYQSQPFDVIEGSGVHLNLEMRSRGWWLSALDWKTGMIFAISLLLVYNFYKDRRRVRK